uniref:Sperm microtubule inner protein 1 C-terminal domain-containing protein n=1 Tax=Salvator merianae TaxID=96440 RepID=A0A8D0E7P7_SALMN
MKGLLTTQQQDAWRELINKEAFYRVTWKAKYGHKYPLRGVEHGISRKKGFLPAICPSQEGPSSPRCQNRAAPKAEEGQQLLGEKGAPSCEEEALREMRAPTPQTTRLLYQGFSHEGQGRLHYLKERQMKSPEEKFYYPTLSSWEYGWRLAPWSSRMLKVMKWKKRKSHSESIPMHLLAFLE